MEVTSQPAKPTTSLQTAALDLLAIHRDAMRRERRTRLHLVQAARRAGLTNQQIGTALGVTEAAVRFMVKRGEG